MPLTLTLKSESRLPVDAAKLVPASVQGKAVAEIERIELSIGNEPTPLGELFTVSGDAADHALVLEGNLANFHHIGQGMSEGAITIRGDAGRHLGAAMLGGSITVHGNAGEWLGAEMRSGLVRVHGNAGNLVGAASHGSTRGMRGGTILIDGNCGSEVGLRMRRGLVAVGGNAGDLLGRGMLAGTLLVFGNCGKEPGTGMKRGTIGLLGAPPASLGPAFALACRREPTVLGLLLRSLREQGFDPDQESLPADYLHYNGDLTQLGKGEVWVRADG